MSQQINLGSYQVILTRMERLRSSGKSLPTPFKSATSIDPFRKSIQRARSLLPTRYQKPYVDVLEKALFEAELALHILGPHAKVKRATILAQLELVFSTLAAPIAQLASASHKSELQAFQAVISDVYRHLVDHPSIRATDSSTLLWPDLDPLGWFSDASGPFTYPASAELPVALISKPAWHRDMLPMWLLDGHEVGGHSIAVKGFHAELVAAVEARLRADFTSGAIRTSTDTIKLAVSGGTVFGGKYKIATVDFMVKLWRYWLHEASADATAMLNMGPMFTDGLILSLALEHPFWLLGTESVFDGKKGFSYHPTGVARVLLSIEMLKKLGIAKAPAYAAAMHKRLVDVAVDLPASLTWKNSKGVHAASMKLSDLQATLSVVADTILCTKLKSLAGHSLLDLMPWNEADENAVTKAAQLLLDGNTKAPGYVKARHVVAGAMLATERASQYSGSERLSKRIHSTGIAMLESMYVNQCLLCDIQTLQEPSTKGVSFQDLFKAVQKFRAS